MTPALENISRADMAATWPHIRQAIAALAEATSEPWTVKDVLRDLFRGAAELWATADLEAFIITTIMAAPYARDLHVWIACNACAERAADFFPQVQDIARTRGCGRVVFESPRRWERALPGVMVRYLYTADLGAA